MKFKITVFSVFAALLIQVPISSASDLSEVADSVPTFFKIMDDGGLNEVETQVLGAYKTYDLRPKLEDLQKIAGVDLAAFLYYENLSPNVKKGMPHYDLWESDAVIARIDRRLANNFKDKTKRGDILLLWLQSVKSRMHLYYLEQENK